MEQDSSDSVIRAVPWQLWIIGLSLLLIGTCLALPPLWLGTPWSGAILGGVGLLMVVLPSMLTIRADRENRILYLCYRSLLTSQVKEIPLDQIASIDAESRRISDHRGVYRVVITERDGTVTPLRSHYGRWDRELQKRLWELTGVHGSTGGPSSLSEGFAMLTGRDETVNQEMRDRQENLTGSSDEIRETADITWSIQSSAMGRVPVTRWFSPDFKTNGTFVYIVQKSPAAGMMARFFSRGIIGRKLTLASMAMYGFADDDIPGKGQARPLDFSELEPHFMALSPDRSAARKILNTFVVQVLADWGEHHPVARKSHTTKLDGNDFVQLVVLYSTNGVYAATIGTLASSQMAELAATGLKLVDAQLSPRLFKNEQGSP